MSHLEARLERDLNNLRQQVSEQASHVQEAIKGAMHALQTGNRKLAYSIVLNDLPINRRTRKIDGLCHSFIAIHLPSAGHLRLISAVIRTNISLERIGDYAVTIARESVRLSAPPSGVLADELEIVSGEALLILEQAIKAFIQSNAEMAKGAIRMAERLDHSMEPINRRIFSGDLPGSKQDQFAQLVIFNQLKRTADLAKNICEDAVFAATGETKSPKVYKILFLDHDNSLASQMAVAIGRLNFPNSGSYSSAGRTPVAAVSQDMIDYLGSRGLSIESQQTRDIRDLTFNELAQQHVIVCLEGHVGDYLDEIPFHTVVLEWDIGIVGDHESDNALEILYRELAVKISDLMLLLRGEGAC